MSEPTLEVPTVCPFCGKEAIVTVPVKGFMSWMRDEMHIQEALPSLTSSEREKLLTGICDDCFPKEIV